MATALSGVHGLAALVLVIAACLVSAVSGHAVALGAAGPAVASTSYGYDASATSTTRPANIRSDITDARACRSSASRSWTSPTTCRRAAKGAGAEIVPRGAHSLGQWGESRLAQVLGGADLSLRDEDWGQRHFITRDPDGLAVDVVHVIPVTSAEAAGHYAPDLLPR